MEHPLQQTKATIYSFLLGTLSSLWGMPPPWDKQLGWSVLSLLLALLPPRRAPLVLLMLRSTC